MKRGRKPIYKTKEERDTALRESRMRWYWRNKDAILEKSRRMNALKKQLRELSK